MRHCSLSTVKRHIVLGEPLSFSVRGADHTLLLARGQVIADEDQLDELFARGALVELVEVAAMMPPSHAYVTGPVAAPLKAGQAERLPRLWDASSERVKRALMRPVGEMAEAVDSTTTQLLLLIDRAPDIALAQVVRQQPAEGNHYGAEHSMNAATACLAAARCLGWSRDEQRRAFQAALTMNLAMLDLQAQLASQVSPLTTNQKLAIREHPTKSAAMLAEAGISDSLWLDAVATHHEMRDGSGYPQGGCEVSELAELLRFADVYTALMSTRANRPAMSAREAGREVYQMAADSRLCAAIIKAVGIFPPGSCVKLASGEMGVVARNGVKAYHPLVAALTTPDGNSRMTPLMRDSARAEHTVVALLPERALPMRLSAEALAGLIATA
jgi:HD-GYP domain-containing protein (c-di-GMP phosphodiesterase class II)